MEDYVYTKLPTPDSIRLLNVHAGPKDEVLRCTFTFAKIASPEPGKNKITADYEAVSYVWGGAREPEYVHCDDYRLAVPKTLAAFLRRLRFPSGTRVLWADAVCINQKDLKERTEQVHIMGQIFEQAARGLYCLKAERTTEQLPLGRSLDLLLDHQTEILHCERVLHQGFNEHHGVEDIFLTVSLIQALGMEPFQTVKEVLGLEWFRRAWILQEFGLSKSGVFIYGSEEIPKDKLFQFVTIYSVFAPAVCREYDILSEMQQAYHMLTAYTTSHIILSLDPDVGATRSLCSAKRVLSFMHVLDRIRESGCKATLEADHLYAYFGHPMASKDGTTVIPVDYLRPAWEVFVDFAKVCVQGPDGLMVLSCVYYEDQNAIPRTMTWIPSWNTLKPYLELGGALGSDIYQAGMRTCHGVPLRGKTTLHGQALLVQGYTIGVVKTVYRPCVEHVFVGESFLKTWGILRRAVTAELGKVPTPEFMIGLLTGGHIGHWPSMATPTVFQFHHSDLIIPAHLKEGRRWETSELFKDWLIDTVSENSRRFCRGRSFFVTDRGHFGFGPHVMQDDDLCCVLYGAHVPMVLRKSSSRSFRLVGEAYVEGIMFEAEPELYEEREFLIL